MGRVSNETNLIVALLKEKAQAQKNFLRRKASCKAPLKELEETKNKIEGIEWALDTLDGIVKEISDR